MAMNKNKREVIKMEDDKKTEDTKAEAEKSADPKEIKVEPAK